jgi:hypothetical protein
LDRSPLPPPALSHGSPGILKFLDLIFFKSNLLTLGGLSTQNLNSTKFHGPPDSIHQQRLLQWIFTHRSVHPTRRRRFTLFMLLSTNLLRFGRFLMVIWPPSMVYFRVLFCFSVFYFILFLCVCFWAFLLHLPPLVHHCNGVWVIVTQYTSQITFIGDPRFVAFVP